MSTALFLSLKEGDQLLGGLGNVESALNYLLRDEALVERLALRSHDQNAALRLEVRGGRRQRGQRSGHAGVRRLLRKETDHVGDSPHDALGARDEGVELLVLSLRQGIQCKRDAKRAFVRVRYSPR